VDGEEHPDTLDAGMQERRRGPEMLLRYRDCVISAKQQGQLDQVQTGLVHHAVPCTVCES